MQQPKLTSKCIICGTSDNLHTTMKVKVDTSDLEIVLCDGCADETTPHMARDAAKKKLDEYQELLNKMKEFGVGVVEETKSGILITEEQTEEVVEEVQKPVQKPAVQKPAVQKPVQKVSTPPSAPIRAPRLAQPKVNVDESLSGENIQVQNTFDPSNVVKRAIQESKDRGRIDKDVEVNIPVTAEVEPQVIDHGGVPMALPKRIRSTDGSVTDITIVNTSDSDIQRRAKELERNKDNPSVHGFSKGYNLTECPLCRGKGILRSNNQACPKCKGNGFI